MMTFGAAAPEVLVALILGRDRLNAELLDVKLHIVMVGPGGVGIIIDFVLPRKLNIGTSYKPALFPGLIHSFGEVSPSNDRVPREGFLPLVGFALEDVIRRSDRQPHAGTNLLAAGMKFRFISYASKQFGFAV